MQASVDISTIHSLTPYLDDIYLELTYFTIQRLDFDDYTTQRIYRLFYERFYPAHIDLSLRYPQADWQAIFHNFSFLCNFPEIHDTWYQLLYNVIPHNSKLFRLKIHSTDLCNICSQPETMEHILSECSYNVRTWRLYKNLVARLLRTSPLYLTYDQLIRFPEFKCFPSRKKKFLLWLTGYTISFLLNRYDYTMSMSYLCYLKFNLHAFSPDQLYLHFARYYTILDDY